MWVHSNPLMSHAGVTFNSPPVVTPPPVAKSVSFTGYITLLRVRRLEMCLDPYKNWIQVDPIFEFLKLLLCCDVALSSPIKARTLFYSAPLDLLRLLSGKNAADTARFTLWYKIVVFRPKSKPLDPDVNVQIEDVTITPSAHVKYLGIVLDEHLSFGVHIAQLERKIGCKLGMFRKARDHLTIDAKRAFYICSIQSILEYGSNSFAHCLSASLRDRVVRLSNRALRIVFCMPRLSDVSLVLARYHIIPLSVRYQFKLYVLTYRALHDLASVFVANCFCLRSNSTCTSSRTRSQVSSSLALPTAKRRYCSIPALLVLNCS